MHVYSEKDPVEINVQGQCTISFMCFLIEKTHPCSQGFILEDCAFLKLVFHLVKENHPQGKTQGNRSLEGREEGWREAKIACEHL